MVKVLIEIETNWKDENLINIIHNSLSKGNVFGEIKKIEIVEGMK